MSFTTSTSRTPRQLAKAAALLHVGNERARNPHLPDKAHAPTMNCDSECLGVTMALYVPSRPHDGKTPLNVRSGSPGGAGGRQEVTRLMATIDAIAE